MENTTQAVFATATIPQTNFLTKKIITVIELICIFIIPPITIRIGWVKNTNETNAIVLGICTITCILITLYDDGWKWNWKSYWNYEIKRQTIFSYTLLTFLGIIFLFLVKEVFDLKIDKNLFHKEHCLYLLFLCWAQVFSFKDFLIRKLKIFTESKPRLVMINAFFFAFMHIMFNPLFICVCVIGGIAFAFVYVYKGANTVLMTISHSFLNFTGGYVGLFKAIV